MSGPEHGLPGLSKQPRIHPTAFVAPGAVVLGDVELGEQSSVWYGAVLRGDVDSIRIGARTNLQDGVVVHCDEGIPCTVEDEVTVGHAAVLHGCTVRRNCLIGIGARVLNLADVGEGTLVAAGALVGERMVVPPGSLVVGIPGKVKELPEKLREGMKHNWRNYVAAAAEYLERLK